METLEFSASERKLYDSIYIDVRKKFERLNEKGLVNKNYTGILAMLMRHVVRFLCMRALILNFYDPVSAEQFSTPTLS